MPITKDRMQFIGNSLRNIRLQLMLIRQGELEEIISDAERDEAIGPLLDPTRWADQDMFSSTRRMKNVLKLIIKLKKEFE